MTFAETSEGIQVTKPKQGKRRSRYQTVSDEVDAAMITIYRELGNTSELRSELSRMRHQVAKLEQENQIQQGKVELVREDLIARNSAEVTWLREEVSRLRTVHESHVSENPQVRAQVQEINLASDERLKEMDEMKAKLRDWLSK